MSRPRRYAPRRRRSRRTVVTGADGIGATVAAADFAQSGREGLAMPVPVSRNHDDVGPDAGPRPHRARVATAASASSVTAPSSPLRAPARTSVHSGRRHGEDRPGSAIWLCGDSAAGRA